MRPPSESGGGVGRPASSLVLGAGGFIGTNLSRALLRRGDRVHGFGRHQAYPAAMEGVRWIQGDFADRAALARALDGMENVFHLVAGSIPESSNRDPVADLLAGTVASLHLLEICRSCGVRKIVFVSSGGTVYGIPKQVPISESAPTDPISAYGISKLAVEKYLALYRHLHGLDYAVLRVANPYGPFQNPHRRQGVVAALLQRVIAGQELEIWGTGEVVRDFVYIDDVVNALLMAAAYDGPYRVFNVGSGVGRSVIQIVDDIRVLLGRDRVNITHRPGRATDVPANVLDIALIQQELGWQPRTDWMEGLRRTAAWLTGA